MKTVTGKILGIHSQSMYLLVIRQYAHALWSLNETSQRLLTFQLDRAVSARNTDFFDCITRLSQWIRASAPHIPEFFNAQRFLRHQADDHGARLGLKRDLRAC